MSLPTPIAAFLFGLFTISSTAMAQETPEELSDQLVIALTANKESSFKTLWDAGKWSKSADNDGYGLYSQAQRKKFVLSQHAIQTQKDRAFVIMDITVQGVVRDRIFLHATASKGTWKFRSIHESPELAAAFLAGHVAAQFDVDTLPTDKLLLEQAQALVARLAEGEELDPDDAAAPLLARLQGKQRLQVQYARAVDSLGRGVASFGFSDEITDVNGEKQRFEESIVGYFNRHEGRWVVYDSGYTPTPSTLFRELESREE